MWCADVLAHGNPVGHFEPYTAADPCWDSTCKDAEYQGGHGHIDAYDDENGNRQWDLGEENQWGYWTCEGYKYLVPETDCSKPKSPTPVRLETAPTGGGSASTSEPIVVVLERIIEDEPEPEVDIEIPEPPVRLETAPTGVEEEWWEWQFHRGWNLVSFPVLPKGVETISDLYHNWGFFGAHNGHIVTHIDNEWLLYSGTNDGVVPRSVNPRQVGTGEIPLSAHLGLAVRLDWASWLGVRGVPLPNEGSIDLRPGVNLVGFADLPHGVRRPSDLLSDVVCAVVVTRRGELYLIGRAGDSGDAPLERGQAVILIATQKTALRLNSPSMEQNISAQGWGAEKMEGVGNWTMARACGLRKLNRNWIRCRPSSRGGLPN